MLVGVVLALAVQVAPDANVEAARAAARKAVDEGRFCDASFYDAAVFGLNGKPSALYNAAENAYAAGDLLRALTLYRDVRKRDVDNKLKPAQVTARIAELEKRVKTQPGQRCVRPAPVCGNGVLEADEACDEPGALCLPTCRLANPPVVVAIEPAVGGDEGSSPVPLVLTVGGGIAVAGGVVAVVGGLQPFFAFQSIDAELRAAESKLADPGDLPQRQAQAREEFASWGSPLVAAGAVAAGVGVVVAVAGLLMLAE